jgi:hypothetical protein
MLNVLAAAALSKIRGDYTRWLGKGGAARRHGAGAKALSSPAARRAARRMADLSPTASSRSSRR